MKKTTNREFEAAQNAKQEQVLEIDNSAKKLDEDSLDSITGAFMQGSSSGGGTDKEVYKPAPTLA